MKIRSQIMSKQSMSALGYLKRMLGRNPFEGGSGRAEERGEADARPRVEVFAMGPDGPLDGLQAELKRELEELFGGLSNEKDCGDPKCLFHGKKSDKEKDAEPKVDWRRKLAEFQMGIPVKVDTRLGVVGMLGLQAWRLAEVKARETGESLTRTIQKSLGEQQLAIVESTTTMAAAAETAADYGKALEVLAEEHEELLERISASNGSAIRSERSWFSCGDLSRACRLVKDGLKGDETYFPQEGRSSIERQLESAQRTVQRLAEAQAMLSGLGVENEKVATLLSSIFGSGDVAEAVNIFVGAPTATVEPIGEVLEEPVAATADVADQV